MTDLTSMYIAESATGSNGDTTREEQIEYAAGTLCDYVYEALEAHGITYNTVVDQHVLGVVARLIAIKMIDQYRFDEGMWGEVIAGICNNNAQLPGT